EVVFLRRDPALYGRDGKLLDKSRAIIGSIPMEPDGDGWFRAAFDGPPRLLYQLRVDGEGPYPDPASRAQPFGVHGPSEITTDWPPAPDAPPRESIFPGVRLEELVLWEAHVGAA